ncbi:BON domain-containing protein [Lignipirellula cremea]|uniref:BON domain protein n=1 Tax=Lignipirellula cremea TaxID=2528010 RepID=A0A518DRE6_9BACT|nr:BON domain-containing protein [Lignipirellula cremea]QDU94406.1 BON domain protein [Lignipirellula cremea]
MSLQNDRQACGADQELQRRVSNFLAERLRPGLNRLQVDVSNGVVTIEGRLTSFYEKQLALNCCQRVAGVVQLVDQLEVAVA